MNDLQIFSNPEFGKVRTINVDGEPWFVGIDVAKSLGYQKPLDAVNTNVDEMDSALMGVIDSLGRNQQTKCINESGLYTLILGSKLEGAKRFRHWITHDVIPSIRKTGSYSMQQKPMTQLEIIAAQAQALVEQERKIAEHENQLAAIEAHQDDADKRIAKMENKIVDVAEAFKAPSFHPDTWQKDTNESINQIVQANGLNHQKYRESLYSRLESIAGVNLRKRQTRAKTRMADAGATKTQLSEVSKLSIVARDKKLRVIFDGILREERAHNIVVA